MSYDEVAAERMNALPPPKPSRDPSRLAVCTAAITLTAASIMFVGELIEDDASPQALRTAESQISSLSSMISGLDSSLEGASATIGSLEAAVSIMSSDLADANHANDNLAMDIGELEADLGNLEEDLEAAETQNASLMAAVETLARMAGVEPRIILRQGLDPVPAMSEFEFPSAESRKVMEDILIGIYAKRKGVEGDDYDRVCTGIKVVIGGVGYVLTARHCIGASHELPEDDIAINILPSSSYDYAVFEPTGSNSDQIGLVTAVSVFSNGSDTALLKIDTSSVEGSLFNDKPGLILDDASQITPPTPLQGAFIYGWPSPEKFSDEDVPVAMEAIYLGRIPDPLNKNQMVDIIAYTEKDIKKIACRPGDSGGAAVVTSGYVITVDSYTAALPEQDERRFGTGTLLATEIIRLRMMQQTNFDLTDYSLCAYSVRPDDMAGLVQGLDVPAP